MESPSGLQVSSALDSNQWFQIKSKSFGNDRISLHNGRHHIMRGFILGPCVAAALLSVARLRAATQLFQVRMGAHSCSGHAGILGMHDSALVLLVRTWGAALPDRCSGHRCHHKGVPSAAIAAQAFQVRRRVHRCSRYMGGRAGFPGTGIATQVFWLFRHCCSCVPGACMHRYSRHAIFQPHATT